MPLMVYLGNRDAITTNEAGKRVAAKGKLRTDVELPDGTSVGEALRVITAADGVWANHAAEGAKPAWVASDSPGLAAVLAEHFGCEVRDPIPDGERGEFAAPTITKGGRK